MGAGDVEIAVVMGWWLGSINTAIAIWMAFILGSVVGVGQMVRGKAKMKSQIAFGPFLIFGSWLAFWWGSRIWELLGFK
jgi:leader peptidase (prepilin peptidase)/N-methyltransferase